MKRMSGLTDNLLHAIDYNHVRQRRTENYRVLADLLSARNRLALHAVEGAFAYPLWVENGPEIRRQLVQHKIYIPTLWPNVIQSLEKDRTERDMAENILPIPCDQRYDSADMEYLAHIILELLEL